MKLLVTFINGDSEVYNVATDRKDSFDSMNLQGLPQCMVLNASGGDLYIPWTSILLWTVVGDK
jgi:hypothetical protein